MFQSQSTWNTQFCKVKFCMTSFLIIAPTWLYNSHMGTAYALKLVLFFFKENFINLKKKILEG